MTSPCCPPPAAAHGSVTNWSDRKKKAKRKRVPRKKTERHTRRAYGEHNRRRTSLAVRHNAGGLSFVSANVHFSTHCCRLLLTRDGLAATDGGRQGLRRGARTASPVMLEAPRAAVVHRQRGSSVHADLKAERVPACRVTRG